VEGRTPTDPDRVVALMLPRVKEAADRGWKSFFDCTPAFIGRDPRVLRRLSGETGIRFFTNTGWYGAAGDKFLPASAFEESAGQLAARWAAEWHEGIEGTGIRPGFIKIGVDAGPLSAIDRKIVVAAARAHLLTGLTIACHTGEGTAALETLDAVEGEGVSADALIVVHADGIKPADVQARLAARGAYVELDGVGGRPVESHVAMIIALLEAGHGGRLLLSHDAGWYTAGEEDGGKDRVRPFTALSDHLLPALEDEGVKPGILRGLVEENPWRAFQVRVRRR
jgi:phosphotriesterase-related protein